MPLNLADAERFPHAVIGIGTAVVTKLECNVESRHDAPEPSAKIARRRTVRAMIAGIPHWIVSPIGTLIVGVSGVVTSSLLARYLGPVGRGHFVEAMVWTNLLLTAGGFVNAQSIAYYWAKGGGREGHSRALSAGLIGAGVLCVILVPTALVVNFLALGITQKPSYHAAELFILTVPLSLYGACMFGVLIAERCFVAYWGVRLCNAMALLVGLVTIAVLGTFNVGNAVLSTLLGSAVAAVVATIFVARRGQLSARWNAELLKPLIGFGAKTSMTSLPYQLNVRLDQVMMSVLLPASQLGLYAAAASWSTMLAFIGSGVSIVMLSRSVAVDPTEPTQVQRLVQQFRVVAWATLFLGLIAAVLAPVGIPLLFGRAFGPSIIPGIVLCLAAVMLNVNRVLHELSRGLGMPEIGMRAELAGLVITVVLLICFLRPFGGLGAALVSVVSYAVVSISMLNSIGRRLQLTSREMLTPQASDAALLLETVRRMIMAPRAASA